MKRRGSIVVIIVIIGGILGAVLGYVLKDIVPILDQGLKVGVDDLSLNLYLFDINFGIHVNITLGAIIGFCLLFYWLMFLEEDKKFKIILASSSPRRVKILQLLKIDFEVIPPSDFQEAVYENPYEMAIINSIKI